MKTFKKILYWVTSPISFLAFVLFTILEGLSERCNYFLHMWEAWCFDYHESWEYLGDGIWKGKD